MSLDHWETYYRGGALVSCPMGLEPGYTREVRSAWVEFFSALPDAARIVDIGTGNGAIPLIASQTAAALTRQFEIHGTDLARIDPLRHVPDGQRLLAGIRFHPGVSAERLPFDAASIDAVSGQYVLEYTDIPRALAEAVRVLRPGGRAQFILHHCESVIVKNAADSLEQADLVFTRTKVLRKFRRYLQAERESPASAPAAWKELTAAGAQLQQGARESASSLTLAFVNDSLRRLFDQRRAMTTGQVQTALDAIEKELRTSVRRLQDLVGAAKSEEEMASIARCAEDAGFDQPGLHRQFHAGDHLVGWRLGMTRL